MNPAEFIRKKRNGGEVTREEIRAFVTAFLEGDIADYQMSAFLMAVYFQGMTAGETAGLTDVMLHSGTVVDLSAIAGVKVDKHSTGGVGDKVSLILAPMVAACGVPVPMISGRGLGHTGGTLDKLESIPGFRTDLSIDEYRKVIGQTGAVMIGQTAEIAPADKRMYALRDVTATVESIPLIAGSIMSKKLAEGIDGLVLDVKTGNGAFMQSYDDALLLAQTLVAIGTRMGKRTVGFVTDMNQPLGHAVGNWLEVAESVECLRGSAVHDLMEVTYVLGGAMVWLGGRAASIMEGIDQCRSAIWSGTAYEKFLDIVRVQGGDLSVIEHLPSYPASRYKVDVRADRQGFVTSFDTMAIGVLATELGAGRLRVGELIDPKAGMIFGRKLGDPVAVGDTLAIIFTDRENQLEVAARRLGESIGIGETPPALPRLVQTYIDHEGVHAWESPALH